MEFPILALSLYGKAFAASVILGIVCGILGTFVVVRRVSLVGDAISHSVLPGVVIGFIISTQVGMDRNPWIILSCATIAGLLSIFVVRQIMATTRLKSDAALGLVLSGFFGIGLAMNKSLHKYMHSAGGLESFIFGNTATISDADLNAMALVSLILITVVIILLRPFNLISFDELYARSLGYPVKLLNLIFFTLLTVSIVVSMQAVGVILVSAMLIIPASTAYLLTERKTAMMLLATVFGAISGSLGFFFSAQVKTSNVPTGPIIVLVAASLFIFAYLAAPRHGIIPKALKVYRRRAVIHRENSLKALYKILEERQFNQQSITIKQVCEVRKQSLSEATKELDAIVKSKDILWIQPDGDVKFTAKGYQRAQQIVRNHRLWELYLTKQADYKADHVHEDAEKIEHILDEETVQLLDHELNFPEVDPHGMPIPRPNPHLTVN